ncbi:TonB family protein [candidate division KSB1 bacterium]|nr:TonB family protein [candidate division KSB1 bacterium]
MQKEFEKQKRVYKRNIEKSLLISLVFFLALVHIFPKTFERKPKELPPLPFVFEIEDIPVTTQTIRKGRPQPQKPVIPIASEDPDIPPDATIDETLIDWDAGDAIFGTSGLSVGSADTIQPRPIVQVLPEYPKELQKQNIRGFVKVMLYINEKGRVEEAVVVENTTASEVCEQAALEAAKRSFYKPASIGKKNVATWVSCTYSFQPD